MYFNTKLLRLFFKDTKWWWWDVKASTFLATSTATNVSRVFILKPLHTISSFTSVFTFAPIQVALPNFYLSRGLSSQNKWKHLWVDVKGLKCLHYACCQWCFTTSIRVSMTMRIPYMHYHLRHQHYILKYFYQYLHFKVFNFTLNWFCIMCPCTVKYLAFLRKRMNTNPSRGPYHFRAPSRIFWRTVRGENVAQLYTHKTWFPYTEDEARLSPMNNTRLYSELNWCKSSL